MKNQNHQQNKMPNGFLNDILQLSIYDMEASSDSIDTVLNGMILSNSKSKLISRITNHCETNKQHVKARERLRAKLEARKSENSL